MPQPGGSYGNYSHIQNKAILQKHGDPYISHK